MSEMAESGWGWDGQAQGREDTGIFHLCLSKVLAFSLMLMFL